jgi:cytochrome bd-type quinol oxidase subunit 2
MKKYIKNVILTVAASLALMVPMLAPAMVSAQAATPTTGPDITGNLCGGAQLNADPSSDCAAGDQTAKDKINSLITSIINIFSLVVGIVAVIMIIIGGLRYITSGGESSNITSAKNTILYAIIGLVVVALAQFLVRFVLARVSGA